MRFDPRKPKPDSCTQAILLLALVIPLLLAPAFAQSSAAPELLSVPGGFLEQTTSTAVRALLTPQQIQAMLPARGLFTFPAPYNTQAIRLTNSGDCGGADCLTYVGYSYWRNMNNHVGSDTMLVFLSLNPGRGGSGPTLFSYNKVTDAVSVVGPLFSAGSPFSYATAEGWYFSGTQPTKIYMNDGPRMLRYDVISKQSQTIYDVSSQFGSDKMIWQMHSSDDDRVHSATLMNASTSEMLGCLVYREDTSQFTYFPKHGTFNECNLDKSGRWLVILEDVDGLYELDNRIIDLQNGTERVILDQDGAAGHADTGYGVMVAVDDWNALPNAFRLWQFGQNPLSGQLVYHNMDWNVSAPNHVSFSNAQSGVPLNQQYACGSGANRINSNRANEISCFRMDSSMSVLVVAPVMTNLDAAGGGDDYSKQPKGNLDVTGQYFIWTANLGGSRLDAFIVKVPGQLLVGTPSDVVPPVVAITSPLTGSTVSGTVAVAATATDNTGVSGVQFKLDGGVLGAEDTSAPYSVSWNTASASVGQHTLTAVARDAAGNSTTSAPVPVTVVASDVTPPVISSVSASSISSSGAVISWLTNESADSQVEFGPTTAYGSSTSLNATPVTSHSQTLISLAPGTLYHYRVKSRDAAGNLALSADFTFTTLSAPPLSSGLLGFWKLDDGSGLAAGDSSGNGNAGTIMGAPIWTSIILNPSLSFDGIDDWVTVANSANLNAYPLSVAVWVKTSASGLGGIVNKYSAGSLNGYQVFMSGGNLCAWYFRDASNYVWDGSPGCTLATPGVADGQWHHVVFTVDASGGKLYVDGALKASRAWTGTPGATTTALKMAFANYPGTATPYLPGLLDDVRIYDRALTGAEVTALRAAVTPSSDTSPPVIASVSSSGITTGEATVSWSTSESADSLVEYGLSTSYGLSTTPAGAPLTAHSVVLSGLAPGTLYHYRARSADPAGNQTWSGDFIFKTSSGRVHPPKRQSPSTVIKLVP